MLNKIFSHGSGGSKGVMDYMLKEKDKVTPREGMTVLRGDVEIQAKLIDSLLPQFKQQYVSGCWSFEEAPDQITAEQKNEIMDGTEKLMLAGLDPDRVSITWIEHTDKGRLELNYIVACVDLEHGRLFQPYIHSHDKDRFNAFRDIQNITHGFTEPLDPAKSQTSSQADNLPRTTKELKEAITAELESQVVQGLIINRDDVKQALTELGYTITRAGKDSISIKNPNPDGRNIKFKSTNEGGLYDIKFNANAEDASQISRASEDFRRSTEQRLEAAQRIFERELERKSDYHENRHGKPMRECGKHERQVERSFIKHEYGNSRSLEILPRNNAPSPFSRTKANDGDVKRSQDSDGNGNARAQQFNHDNHKGASTSVHNISHDSSSNNAVDRHIFWDLYSKNILNPVIKSSELAHEQTANRSSQSSDASAAGNDSASEFDARSARSRYSSFESFIEKISARANRESQNVTRSLIGLEQFHLSLDKETSALVGSASENTKQSEDFDERATSTITESEKLNKPDDELSERIAELDDLERRSEKIRERATGAEPFARVNQHAVGKIERHIKVISKPTLEPSAPVSEPSAPISESTYTSPRPRFR